MPKTTKTPPKRLPPRLLHIKLEEMQCIDYCINVVDNLSGQKGNFAYDTQMNQQHGWHIAISPVFPTLDEFYNWAKAQGFKYHRINKIFTMCRTFE